MVETKSYITYLIQKLYLNLFLQEEVVHRYLNIRSFDEFAKGCYNEFSKCVFEQELKSSYSNKSFFLPNNMFKKMKKINWGNTSHCLRFNRNKRSY